MSETVYIETSILGYLTARPTKNLILAANIEVTRDWWEFRRRAFTLYVSEAVLNEVALGDAEIAVSPARMRRVSRAPATGVPEDLNVWRTCAIFHHWN